MKADDFDTDLLRQLKLTPIRLNDARDQDLEGSKTVEYCKDLTDLNQVLDERLSRQNYAIESNNDE